MKDTAKAEEMKGRVKKSVGELTDDPGLKREGSIDVGSARAKQGVSKVADKLKDTVNPKVSHR